MTEFKNDHKALNMAISDALILLPPPLNSVARYVYDNLGGSEKEKADAVLEHFDNIRDQGIKHYEVLAFKLDGALQGIDDLKSLGKNQNKILQSIQDVMSANFGEIDVKIDGLKTELGTIGITVGEISKDVKEVRSKKPGRQLTTKGKEFLESMGSAE